jgi:hypothetical protein
MPSPRFSQLLGELRQLTDGGRVRWGETADDASFRIGLGGGMVRVSAVGNDVIAYLIDAQGRVVDEVTDNELAWLGRLYGAARSSALNVDGLIDDMTRDLRQGNVTTPPPEPKPDPDDLPPF